MKGTIIQQADIRYLEDEIFDANGLLKPMPYKFYSTIADEHLALCGHKHGIYLFPTIELVQLVAKEIGSRKAIEIGAGNGCLGRALGIPMTDSHLQSTAWIKKLYQDINQPTIKYPADVIRMTAEEAVAHYKPECVVAAWVTQKWHKGDKEGCMYGVDEWEIINKVDKYIFIGNYGVHMGKRVMRRYGLAIGQASNKDGKDPVIYSRSIHRELDAIWTWEKIKPGMDREDKWVIEA